MYDAVSGYYDGKKIVMDEEIELMTGQRVIITILEHTAKKPGRKTNLSKYVGRGPKLFHEDAAQYVKGLRADDRL